MNEMFSHLLQRHQGTTLMVEPRRSARFEAPQVAFAPSLSLVPQDGPQPAEAGEQLFRKVEPSPAPNLFEPRAARNASPVRAAPKKNVPVLKPDPQPRSHPESRLGGHGSQEGADAASYPAHVLPEIHRRFSTMIACSAQRRGELQSEPTAGVERAHDQTRFTNHPVSPGRDAALSAGSPPVIQPPAPLRRQMVGPERPIETTARPQDLPRISALVKPVSEVPAGEPPAALNNQASMAPVGEDGAHAREHLLVPPAWLALLQRDFQRRWDALNRRGKSEPTIMVTIGRVEVRAEAPALPQKPRAKSKPPAVMSLDAYLNQRKGRGAT